MLYLYVAVVLLKVWLDDGAVMPAVLHTILFLVLIGMAVQVLTPTRLYSLLPWRSVLLREARATLFMAERQHKPGKGTLRLQAGGKATWIFLMVHTRAERERILSLLMSSCSSYSEERVAERVFGIPEVKTGVYDVVVAVLGLLYLIGMSVIDNCYTPTPPPKARIEQQGTIQ